MIRDLSFVELTVADWPTALAWYRDVLGLTTVVRDEANRFALLQAGGSRLALKEGTPEPGTVRLAFEVDDLENELELLAIHGVHPEDPLKTSAEGYRRALLRDRDGYQVMLFEWSTV